MAHLATRQRGLLSYVTLKIPTTALLAPTLLIILEGVIVAMRVDLSFGETH